MHTEKNSLITSSGHVKFKCVVTKWSYQVADFLYILISIPFIVMEIPVLFWAKSFGSAPTLSPLKWLFVYHFCLL